MNIERFANANAYCLRMLEWQGVTLSVVTDADRIIEIAQVLKDPSMTPEVAPLLQPYTTGRCFWLVAERSGQAIAAGGARFDDLEDEAFSTYLERCARIYHGRPWEPAALRVDRSLDKKLGGKLVYFGHLRSDSGPGSLARTALFVKAGQMLSAIKWDPDAIYIWLKRRHAEQGAHARYGFATRVPETQVWGYFPPGRMEDDLCVFNDRLDLELLAAEIAGDYSKWQISNGRA